jgi:hypothetical protein
MDLATAAAYLQLSAASARRLFRRERLEPIGLGLRCRRWRRADLDELLARLGRAAQDEDGAAADALRAIESRLRQGKPPSPASGGT